MGPESISCEAKDLNTPRLVADDTQKTVWKWEQQEPFGAGACNPDPDGDNVQFEFNLRFAGQYFDKETNAHYNYFRDYDPAIGRYVQSDPIGLEGGLNTYLYAEGSPTAYSDPFGQHTILRVLIGVGAVAMKACMRNDRCRRAVEEARKACTDIECVWKREKADHKFENGKYCEHYRLTCYRKGKKGSPPVFDAQIPFPGRCFDRRQDQMSD